MNGTASRSSNTPLPRWWLWTFYATIIWAIAYTIFYPAWPLVSKATAGALNWSSRGQLEEQLAVENARRAPIMRAIAAAPDRAKLRASPN